MGLISFIKRLLGFTATTTGVISAGSNFRFVAQNIATIYCIVEHSSFGKTLTKEQKMYTAALIDMYAYLIMLEAELCHCFRITKCTAC